MVIFSKIVLSSGGNFDVVEAEEKSWSTAMLLLIATFCQQGKASINLFI